MANTYLTTPTGGETRSTLTKPLSVREAAEFLGVSLYTLKDWRLRGVGPDFFYGSPAKRNPLYTITGLQKFQDERLNGGQA